MVRSSARLVSCEVGKVDEDDLPCGRERREGVSEGTGFRFVIGVVMVAGPSGAGGVGWDGMSDLNWCLK